MQPDEILFQRRDADPEARNELIARKLPALDRASILARAA